MTCFYDVSDDGGEELDLDAIEAELFYELRMFIFLNPSPNLMSGIVGHLLEPVRIYQFKIII